jgi:vitamin B12 transporter
MKISAIRAWNLSCDINPGGRYSYNWNLGYNNPEAKSDKKGYWDRKYGRIQMGGGVLVTS